MRILYVYDGDWPRAATRVRKQTQTLAASGHEVLLLSRNETRQDRDQEEAWMAVRRLPSFPTDALNRLLNFPLFFNPVWLGALEGARRRQRSHLILVEDLPLAPSALAVGTLSGAPVIYDMGEVYPEFLRGLTRFKRRSLTDRLIRNPRAGALIERWVLPRVSHTFVVSEESRTRAIEKGAVPSRVTVVGNTPQDPRALRAPAPPPPEIEALSGRPVILFVGILISDRGLPEAARAMDLVRREVPEAVLLVVGDGPERPRVEEEVGRLGLVDQVVFAGWKAHDSLPGYYQHSVMGLLPFLDGGQIRFTLANKLFDYMSAGLPVVASDVPPMRRVLEETGAGLLVEPGNPTALAHGILRLLRAEEENLRRFGEAGIRGVRETYNWTNDARRMMDVIGRFDPRTD